MGTAGHNSTTVRRPTRGTAPRAGRSPFVPLLLLLAGCKANNRYDLLEAELRTRNRELAEARAVLQNARLTGGAYPRGCEPGCGPSPTDPRPLAPASVPGI